MKHRGSLQDRQDVGIVAIALLLATIGTAKAQLEFTEIMFDSAADEPKWEWIEVRNAGASDIDLNGYFFDDASSSRALDSANINAMISDEIAVETVVPAGRVAVLYNGSSLEYSAARFRAAWNLSATIPLIGVDRWPSLNNGGDAVGLWANLNAYSLDLENIDEDEDLEVAQFDSSAAWIDYREDFPSPTGASIEWSGMGDYRAADNWFAHEQGTASLSIATFLDDQTINSVLDIGNPGTLIGFGEPAALVITELMYNPASDEPAWEWVEIFNGSGETINFAERPHFLDDLAGNAQNEANITEGTIEDGGIAVLFREGVDEDLMRTAWGEDINFIPVSSWPSLNNDGDLVGIWNDEADYLADSVEGQDRSDAAAITSVNYLDGVEDWPNVGNGNSISMLDLEADANDPTNWSLSEASDGDSFFARPAIASQQDHRGGDVGTPGVFGELLNSCVVPQDRLLGDLDKDGVVGFSDFLILSTNFLQAVSTYEEGDIDCDGSVAFADFLALSDSFGQRDPAAAAVPEPSAGLLSNAMMIVLMGLVRCRRR